jgi:hypothetical protein
MNCAVCTHELIGLHPLARYCSSLCRRTAKRDQARPNKRRRKRKRNPGYWRRKRARYLRRKFCKRYRNDRAFRKKVIQRAACRHYARNLGFVSYPDMQRHQRAIRVALRMQKREQKERARRRRRTPEELELQPREYRREYNSKPANRQRRNERARHRRRIARTVAAALREMDWLDARLEFKVGLWNWQWLDPPRSRHERKRWLEKKQAAIVHVARELELLPQGGHR